MARQRNHLTVNHIIGGGWATDFGETVDVSPNQAGDVIVPFLVDANNAIFTLDGGSRKIPGTAKLNSVALESGASVKGLFDYWQGHSTQHRVVFVGTKIKKDDADGTFTDLFTGLTSGAVPSFAQLDDILIMANDSSGDVPKSWDGTTAQNLAGTPPSFSICAAHQNRAWAAGVAANSSRLYYSVLLDPEDWIGSGSGSIDIDPEDGDEIRAIISHRNELFVFKGPNRGSIHRITGSAPTGADAFARKTFASGVGAVGQNSVFSFANDVGFLWSDGNVRTLSAVQEFGDFAVASLTSGINQDFIQPSLNFNRLKHAVAAVDTANSLILIGLPINASNDLNFHLAIDYRFQPFRLAPYRDLPDGGCLASVVDPTNVNKRILMLGGADGFVRKWNQNARSIDGTGAITWNVQFPVLNYGGPMIAKTLDAVSLSIRPRGSGDITLKWRRDEMPEQTSAITQTAGPVLDTFVLDVDTLASGRAVEKFADALEGGEFRGIQYTYQNAISGEDAEVRRLRTSIIIQGVVTE